MEPTENLQRLLIKINEKQKMSIASEGSDHPPDTPISKAKQQLDSKMKERVTSLVPSKQQSFQSHFSDPDPDSDDQQHHLEKIKRLIDRTKNKLRNNKVSQEQQFYNKNIKKFEGLDTFINSRQLMSNLNQQTQEVVKAKLPKSRNPQHPISIHGHDKRASVYMDYLVVQELKEQEQAKQESQLQKRLRQKKLEAFFREYHGMFWEANNDNEKNMFENENMNRYNDFKYLLYLETFLTEAQRQEALQHEEDQDRKIKDALNNEQLLELQQQVLKQIQKQYSPKFEEAQVKAIERMQKQSEDQHLEEVAKEFKKQSDKVLVMIRQAAKKIFNKKEDLIRKELMQSGSERMKRAQARNQLNKQLATSNHDRIDTASTNQRAEVSKSQPTLPATPIQKSKFAPIKLPPVPSPNQSIIASPNNSVNYKPSSFSTKSLHNSIDGQKPQSQSLEQIKLNRLLGSLSSLQRSTDVQSKRLSSLSKKNNAYFKGLEEISKPNSIKATLQDLLDRKRVDYDHHFYKKIQNSFKKQML